MKAGGDPARSCVIVKHPFEILRPHRRCNEEPWDVTWMKWYPIDELTCNWKPWNMDFPIVNEPLYRRSRFDSFVHDGSARESMFDQSRMAIKHDAITRRLNNPSTIFQFTAHFLRTGRHVTQVGVQWAERAARERNSGGDFPNGRLLLWAPEKNKNVLFPCAGAWRMTSPVSLGESCRRHYTDHIHKEERFLKKRRRESGHIWNHAIKTPYITFLFVEWVWCGPYICGRFWYTFMRLVLITNE